MRTTAIKFRVSADELAAIRERADSTGETVSEFVRTLALRGRVVPREAINELIREVNKVGVNLNQLARRANEAGHTDKIYRDARGFLDELRAYCYRAMGQQ
ncbi:MAG: hypothetical protein OHK006_11900 [Thermodesulfovibrionales bacterium]